MMSDDDVLKRGFKSVILNQSCTSTLDGENAMFSRIISRICIGGLFFILFTATPAATQPPPPTLTIDPAVQYAPISPYLYGVNIANWCAWYYINQLAPLLKDAGVTVVRLGATNMERYNYQNNRMFNAVARMNQYVPMSWRSFIEWTRNDLEAEPFLQASAYGHVAGEGTTVGQDDYDRVQTSAEVQAWAESAAADVTFWGIGNEPFIAWKRYDYPGIYSDLAHGDQVLNYFTSYNHYFDRFRRVAGALKDGRPEVRVFGPTPANWFLYWSNEYSPFCPVTTPNGPPQPGNAGWQVMSDPLLMWDANIFPDRGEDPDRTGWETDPRRAVCQYLSRMNQYATQEGRRPADYLDVHRYIQAVREYDAVQEPRGLWEDDFQSWDLETLYSGIKTRVLKRLNAAVDMYYPGTKLAFSEYGFFYWSGYPDLDQNSAIGLMDFLGFFSRGGVEVACDWYVGEPNQSAGDFAHAVDSAKQAMFDEQGRPKPKYWAFYLMSHHFHGTAIRAEASDWDRFSVHAALKDNGDVVVAAVYKGEYDAVTGDLLPTQSPMEAILDGLPIGLGLKRLFRLGLDDPAAVEMDPAGLSPAGGRMPFLFQPLAIYVFEFSARPADSTVTGDVLVNPRRIDFGPYDTGLIRDQNKTIYTHPVQVTSTALSPASWSISEDSPWLTVVGAKSGSADVTDSIPLVVDRNGLTLGTHQAEITVNTSAGDTIIPVTLNVIPGEAGGERRISDFETGSLAHTWNTIEPYAVGWWDGHGGPEDMDSPYIYRFYMEHQDLCRLGDTTSLKIDFNRENGDTENGRFYLSFGTYGHQSSATDDGGNPVVHDATGDWTGFDSFQFDIKTDTLEADATAVEIILSDLDGHRGKPDVLISGYDAPMTLVDGMWRTIIIPLDAVFYNWASPGGQDGSTVRMNVSAISQIEILPWAGSDTKQGTILLDNLRLVKTGSAGNAFPVAQSKALRYQVTPGQRIVLDGTPSFDPDGRIATYQWLPADHLSDPHSPRPVFQSDKKGEYPVDLIVTDQQGLASRNIVQVLIEVGQGGGGGGGQETTSGGAGVSGGCFIQSVR
jgi:hypothetical protein